MADVNVGWDDVTRGIVDGVVASIRREYFMGYVGKMREIGASSEKLMNIYLTLFQPQTMLLPPPRIRHHITRTDTKPSELAAIAVE